MSKAINDREVKQKWEGKRREKIDTSSLKCQKVNLSNGTTH